jgi:cytochrome c oxidase assembly protein subunit 15
MTTLLWLYARRQPLPPHIRRLVHILLAAAGAQVTLGISTLLYNVPIPLASAHQTGSLVVLTAALHLAHALKRSPIKF